MFLTLVYTCFQTLVGYDQSIFIFTRQDYQEHLSYLAGRVLPLGSSMIERVAAEKCGKTDCMSLEVWRERKKVVRMLLNLKKREVGFINNLNEDQKVPGFG